MKSYPKSKPKLHSMKNVLLTIRLCERTIKSEDKENGDHFFSKKNGIDEHEKLKSSFILLLLISC